jgi:hypothetical protein
MSLQSLAPAAGECNPTPETHLNLLLLLTALFASLTGNGSGERAVGMQGVAVVRSTGAAQAAVQPARRAIPAAVLPQARRSERADGYHVAAAPLVSVRRTFERRLE